MRWLFLFVLMLNIAYVGWELSQPEMVPAEPVVDRRVPGIVLLSEIGQESVAVSKSATERLPDEGKKKAAAQEADCFTLGPFRELEKLRAVTRGIKKYVVAASFRSHEEREQERFWVYLPPAGSFSEAKELAGRLKKMRVNDYFIVKSGPQINAISLGHFAEKKRAYTHAERMTKLGLKPEVEILFKNYTIYWLDYEIASVTSIPDSVLAKHITGKINHLIRDCS
ncbi:MAG: hypothetical protein RQ936_09235 [Gammaproteobacteria bacterium]|nr:hypothetical protein [Gammaproteobacteria bacterium]